MFIHHSTGEYIELPSYTTEQVNKKRKFIEYYFGLLWDLPKITMCTFRKHDPTDKIQHIQSLWVLSLNMYIIFPDRKITMCTFRKHDPTGEIQRIQGLWVLPLNMYISDRFGLRILTIVDIAENEIIIMINDDDVLQVSRSRILFFLIQSLVGTRAITTHT